MIASISSSVQGVVKDLFAGNGSPSRAKVDMEPTNGTMDLPAMVVQRMLKRRKNGGEKMWR